MRRTRTTLLLILVAAATISTSASTTGHGGLLRHVSLVNTSTSTISCWVHERDALLEFNQGITGDPSGILDSWQPGGQGDCCRWRGVRCSNRTGHVVGINLRNFDVQAALVGQISPSLVSLKHLKHLDLSLNKLQGPSQRLPEFLGSLKNLRYLNLSNIPFHDTVPPQLGNLTNLRYLDLSCQYYGDYESQYSFMNSIDISWLARLPSLRVLNMGNQNLSMVLDWLNVVNMLPSLVVLDLSMCSLTSANQSVPHLNLTKLERLVLSSNYFLHPVASCWFWNLTSLTYLEVRGNVLYGQFPVALGGMTSLQVLDFSYSGERIGTEFYSINKGLDTMTVNMTNLCNLEILDLTYSLINGNITELFGRLPQCPLNNLKKLYLRGNNFTGVLPREIGTLSNLTDLYLGGNNLSGLVTHELLAGLKSLLRIDLSGNSLKIVVDPKWLPPFRLQSAYFESCKMGPQFPTWLQSQVDIIDLDMFSVGISDNLPGWFCTTFSNASRLIFSNNRINGTLPTNMEVMTSLEEIYLDSNQLTGQVPKFPEQISTLDISKNSLSGPLPSNFGAPFIKDLRLFSNRINGHVPQYMCQLQNLHVLNFADNLFEGELPPCFQPYSMEMLIASNNRISGKIPPSLKKCTNLTFLDLAWNKFFGELPVWIGDLVSLEVVRLSYNNFSGSIPASITNLKNLRHLNLAANSISGVMPWHLSNLTGMQAGGSLFRHFVNFHPLLNLTVVTKGHQHYYDADGFFAMVSIDLSSNFLTGEIPQELTSLDGLRNLNLSWNHLSGKIPLKIGVMESLESLDLSRNKLYGELPQSLSNLTSLSDLDVSHNNLTGRIPSGGQLESLYAQNPFMYDDNTGLCGYPLQKNCSDSNAQNHERDEHDYSGLISFPFGLGVGYMVGLWSVVCVILFRKSWRIAYFRLLDKVYDNLYMFVIVIWATWSQKASTN